MARQRRPPKSPASFADALRRLWKSTDPQASGPPTEFSLGERPAAPSTDMDQSERPKRLIPADLNRLRQIIRNEFDTDHNSDVIARAFRLALKTPRRALLLYVEGLADRTTESRDILEPLMLFAKLNPDAGQGDLIQSVEEQLSPGAAIIREARLDPVFEKVLTGMTALFVDGCPEALLIESKGWERRSVGRPQEEPGVRTPQEAFVETLRVNTALVRRRIRTTKLVIEALRVGELTRTDVAVLYIRDLTSEKLVEEVRRRLRGIRFDYTGSSGMIEQLISDRPRSLFPQTLTTERPDRVAAALADGFVAILVDTSPFALVVPANYTSLFQAPEDYYLGTLVGTVTRLIRVIAALLTLLISGFFIAAVSYHPEMIPTPLLLTIAASRVTSPFPLWLEVLIMEFAFQLVREAGVRIPSVIGPTIGIVGALILGQAAVAANLISPVPVVLVAITALGSFAIPNYVGSYSLQILRFVIIVSGSLLGFFGIALTLFGVAVYLSSLTSFGVPYMSPLGPYVPGNPDLIVRGPLRDLRRRPKFLRPQDEQKHPGVARRWDSPEGTGDQDGGEGESGR